MRFVTVLVVALVATVVSSTRIVQKKFAEAKTEFSFAMPTAITCPLCSNAIVAVENIINTKGCAAADAAIAAECAPCASTFATVCPQLTGAAEGKFTPQQACALMKLC